MWEGPEAELQLTLNTQPAILAHSVAVWSVVKDRIGPVAGAAGHSLGEYSAYVAAGSFSMEDGVRLVRTRGELMHQAGTIRPGAMAAVLGLEGDRVVECCAQVPRDKGVAVAANLNAPDQTVISGDPAAVDEAGALCKSAGAKRVMPLKVSGAFHSPLMTPAAEGLEAALQSVPVREPAFPVVANATAESVTDSATALRLLAAQLTAPVRWVECVTRLVAMAPGARFIELGPGTVLGGLLKRIAPSTTYLSLGTADEVEAFLA
jgi:[acyl-carrier-protein] S-malonyltransferase